MSSATGKTSLYSWYVLALLVLIYGFNWIDRYVLVVLVEPIKQDLGLSDSALGFLTGFAFSIIYSIIGIPLAYLADRYSRRNLLLGCLSFWSVLTVVSGFARNFVSLALCRIGVAAGEAGCSPAAHSLIADSFPAHRRGTAYAIYGLGISFGIGTGLWLGGWANEHYGWQSAFFFAGIPGLLMALLVALTMREPPRVNASGDTGKADDTPPLWDSIRLILSYRWFWFSALGLGLLSFSGSAFEMWTPAYLMRVQGYQSGETGAMSGLVEGLAGIVGTLIGGILADRLAVKDIRWYLWFPALVGTLMMPAMFGFLRSNHDTLLYYYVASILCTSAYMAPIVAVIQTSMPAQVRAQASALMLLVLNMMGPGAGSFVAGILTDHLTAEYGQLAIRYSLSITTLVAITGIISVLLAAKALVSTKTNVIADVA